MKIPKRGVLVIIGVMALVGGGYLVLGAGQGATERFDTEGEVHSTPGTLIFSYGLPGSVLFVLFLWNIVGGDAVRSTLLLAPLLAYGLVHNGLRFPWFWLAVCVIYYCASTARPDDAQSPRSSSVAHSGPA